MSERLKPPQSESITPKTEVSSDVASLKPEEQENDLELTPQEKNQLAYQEKTAKRYDELLQEREDLQKQLLEYDSRYNRGLLLEGMLSDAKVQKINSDWLQAVRKQTEFLKPLDDLGIKIFTDDLADQPNFPDIKITFESAKVAREKITELNNMGGMAMVKEVHIGSNKLSLRQQLFDFMLDGQLNGTTTVLIHELIHSYHDSDGYIAYPELTEAQAYWSGVLGGKFSLVDTINILIQPEKEGGLYEFDQEKITRILLCVTALSGLGKSEKEIADLIRIAKFDTDKEKYSPLEDELEKLTEANGLDEIDTQAARDLYRLHVSNQRKKTLLLLDETIGKNVNKEERARLDKKRVDILQSQFLRVPFYDIDSKELSPREEEFTRLQFDIIPNSKEFPYEFNGKRASIIFGIFYDEIKKTPTFELGRAETVGKKSKVELAVSDEEKNKLIGIMEKQAKLISFSEKTRLLLTALESGKLFFADETAVKVLNAFISSGEAKEIMNTQQFTADCLNMYDGMKADKMNEYKFEEDLKDKWEKKIKVYAPMVESYLKYLKIFNLKIDELNPAIATSLKNIIVWLKNCQAILKEADKTKPPTGLG